MLFYERPVLLSRDHHRQARLGNAPDLRFTARANSVLLAAEECVDAMRDFPILFIGRKDGHFTLAALTGLKSDHNLFVTPEGLWLEGTYLPAFIRRYPFVLVDAPDGGDMQIAADQACAWLDLPGRFASGERLMQDSGENTPRMDEIASFLLRFHQGMLESRTFATRLAELKLLVPRTIMVKGPQGKSSLDNFHVVDEQALLKLDAETTKELTSKGYMAWINFHLASLSNIQRLADLYDRQEVVQVASANAAGIAPAPMPQAPKPLQ